LCNNPHLMVFIYLRKKDENVEVLGTMMPLPTHVRLNPGENN